MWDSVLIIGQTQVLLKFTVDFQKCGHLKLPSSENDHSIFDKVTP
jgi:hypothetical protein